MTIKVGDRVIRGGDAERGVGATGTIVGEDNMDFLVLVDEPFRHFWEDKEKTHWYKSYVRKLTPVEEAML